MPATAELVELMREGERFFLDQLVALDDAALDAASLLPDWTRRHVVAHVARNADALHNLLTWARTGVETPMYASAEARNEGIETTRRLPADALRVDVQTASSGLMAAADSLPPSAWDAPVRTARGRDITAADVPWMRIREAWVHAVDLGATATFGDLPQQVIADFLDDVAGDLRDVRDCPAAELLAADSDRTWRIGPAADAPVHVRGRSGDLLGWLLGRTGGAGLVADTPDERPPAPSRWL